MVTTSKKRKFTVSKKRFIGKPTGQIQERVQAVGPEHFGVVAVDCVETPLQMDALQLLSK